MIPFAAVPAVVVALGFTMTDVMAGSTAHQARGDPPLRHLADGEFVRSFGYDAPVALAATTIALRVASTPNGALARRLTSRILLQHRWIEYGATNGLIRDHTAYHGYFTLPEADPEYHGGG